MAPVLNSSDLCLLREILLLSLSKQSRREKSKQSECHQHRGGESAVVLVVVADVVIVFVVVSAVTELTAVLSCKN